MTKMTLLLYTSIVFFLLIKNFGNAERSSENQWFRDRMGNSIELLDYSLHFSKAGSTERLRILTQDSRDISKIVTDYQRSYALFMGGTFKNMIGSPPGNLYILFTEKLQYCNSSVVAYQIVGDLLMAEMTGDGRNNDIGLDFGHMGRVTITKGLLLRVLKEIDLNKYYSSLYCVEDRGSSQIFVGSSSNAPVNTVNRPTQIIPSSNQANGEQTAESELDNILFRHSEILIENKNRLESYINNLELLLKNAYSKLKRYESREERIPTRPIVDTNSKREEFSLFLRGKFENICKLKTSIVLGNGMTFADVLLCRDDLRVKQKKLDSLEQQFKKIKQSITSRFGEEEDTSDALSLELLTPFNAALATQNYSCLLMEEANVCVNLIKIYGNVTTQEDNNV